MKKVLLVVLSILMVITLTACGNKDENGNSGELFSKSLKASDLSIDDFEWETNSSKCNGYDCYVFSLTNNSKYDIIAVQFSYKVRDEVTEDELDVYENFMNDHEGFIEEDDSPKNVTLIGSRNTLVSKGETLTDLRFTVGYENLYWYDYPTDEQFELMEPDELQIGVVGEDNKLYIAYYDFETKKWKLDTKTASVDTWSTSELSKKIERPTEKHHVVYNDDEYSFEVYSYGVTSDDYKDYTMRITELGFVTGYQSSSYYIATHNEGYEIELSYNKEDLRLNISVFKGI